MWWKKERTLRTFILRDQVAHGMQALAPTCQLGSVSTHRSACALPVVDVNNGNEVTQVNSGWTPADAYQPVTLSRCLDDFGWRHFFCDQHSPTLNIRGKVASTMQAPPPTCQEESPATGGSSVVDTTRAPRHPSPERPQSFRPCGACSRPKEHSRHWCYCTGLVRPNAGNTRLCRRLLRSRKGTISSYDEKKPLEQHMLNVTTV